MQNPITPAPPARSFFYGWLIVAVATLAMMVTNGLAVGGLPVFFKPLLTDLGITDRSVIARAGMITFLISGGLAPVVGNLIGRVNLRALMTLGCVFLGAGLALYSRATKPTDIYLAHMLLGLCLCCASLIPNTVLVSNWFNRLRGVAMGIVITGTSLGTMLIPKLAVPLIERYNWRFAMLALSGLAWFVLIPALWLVVRVHPQEVGQERDGAAPTSAPAKETVHADAKTPIELPGMTLGQALHTPLFYLFSLCAALLFYAILAVVQQLTLYLQSPRLGMTLAAAGTIQTTLGGASIVGKLAFGWLSDRLPKAWVHLACCAVLCLAASFLLNLTAPLAFPFALAFGFGYGGAFVLVQLMVAECFGLREQGRILGIILIVETVGGGLGIFLTGALAQAAGDYAFGFRVVFAATVVALLAALPLIRLMPKRAEVA